MYYQKTVYTLAACGWACALVIYLAGCDPLPVQDGGILDASAPAVDAFIDGGCPNGLWCRDSDADGWPRFDDCREGCEPLPPLVGQWLPVISRETQVWDCDDHFAGTNPEGVEICDGRDNDCDGREDADLVVSCQSFEVCAGFRGCQEP